MADDEEYNVERVLDHTLYERALADVNHPFREPADMFKKRYHSTYLFYVKWENYSDEWNTWEPEDMFDEGNFRLESYKRRMGLPLTHSKVYFSSGIHEKPLKASASRSDTSVASNTSVTKKEPIDATNNNEEESSTRTSKDLKKRAPSKRLADISSKKRNRIRSPIQHIESPVEAVSAAGSSNKNRLADVPSKKRNRNKSPIQHIESPVEAVRAAGSSNNNRKSKKDVRLIRYHEDSSNLNCGLIHRDLILTRRCTSTERLDKFWMKKAVEHKQREILNSITSRIYKEKITPIRQRNIQDKKKVNSLVVYMSERKPGLFRVSDKLKDVMDDHDLPRRVKAPLLHAEALFPPCSLKGQSKRINIPAPRHILKGTFNGLTPLQMFHVKKFLGASTIYAEVSLLARIIVVFLNKEMGEIEMMLKICAEPSNIVMNLLLFVPLRNDIILKDADILKNNMITLSTSEGDSYCSVTDDQHWKCRMIAVLFSFMQAAQYNKVETLASMHMIHKCVSLGAHCLISAFLSSGCPWTDGTVYEVDHGLDLDVNFWILLQRNFTKVNMLHYMANGFDPFSVTWSTSPKGQQPVVLGFKSVLARIQLPGFDQRLAINETFQCDVTRFCNTNTQKELKSIIGPSFQYGTLTPPHVIGVSRFSNKKIFKRSIIAGEYEGCHLLRFSENELKLLSTGSIRIVLCIFPLSIEKSVDVAAKKVNSKFSLTASPRASLSELKIRFANSQRELPLERISGSSSPAHCYTLNQSHSEYFCSGGIEISFTSKLLGSLEQCFVLQMIAVDNTK